DILQRRAGVVGSVADPIGGVLGERREPPRGWVKLNGVGQPLKLLDLAATEGRAEQSGVQVRVLAADALGSQTGLQDLELDGVGPLGVSRVAAIAQQAGQV